MTSRKEIGAYLVADFIRQCNWVSLDQHKDQWRWAHIRCMMKDLGVTRDDLVAEMRQSPRFSETLSNLDFWVIE